MIGMTFITNEQSMLHKQNTDRTSVQMAGTMLKIVSIMTILGVTLDSTHDSVLLLSYYP